MGKTLVMGIVNVTPDSFSDGGQFMAPQDAIRHAYALLEQGADILDIGAESTRPGHQPVAAEEEWTRLAPVLKELTLDKSIRLSLDTTKASVASRALELGVSIINDIWGGAADPEMLPLVASSGAEYIWMHNRLTPTPAHAVQVLLDETRSGIERCLEAGIRSEKLWIDPGIGFGKTHLQNLQILSRIEEFCGLGPPVLLGTSRKRVIGDTLRVTPEERLEGSLATVSVGVLKGVAGVRVHDVLETVRTCRMVEAIRDVDKSGR